LPFAARKLPITKGLPPRINGLAQAMLEVMIVEARSEGSTKEEQA
jgi:hypothetical protein